MQKRTKYQVRSDAAKQRWVRDEKKEAFWRKQVEAWKLSGLSKRGYCIAHNLSESSFNAWRREIELRDREKVPSANASELLRSRPEHPESSQTDIFVPLRLLPECNRDAIPEEKSKRGDPGFIELVLPGGYQIRVSGDSDMNLLQRIINLLEGRKGC